MLQICLKLVGQFYFLSISLKFFSPVVFLQEEDDVDGVNMEEDVDGDMADIEALNYDDLDSVSKLQKTQRYNDIMQVCLCIMYASIVTMCTVWFWLNVSSVWICT